MDPKKSTGFDKVSNKVVKALKSSISRPLTTLINHSLKTGKETSLK